MSGKTQYKQKFDQNGVLRNVKAEDEPAFVPTMPTEVRKPNFKPEGRILLCDFIPFEAEDKAAEDATEKFQLKDQHGHVVETVAIEGMTESGLLIPKATKKDRVLKAVVNAIGEDVRGYDIGDIVVYKPNPQATFLIEVEGHTYVMMEQYNLVGKYI